MNDRTSKRARGGWLAALAVLVLALILFLTQFVGQGGCTSAIAFDRPAPDESTASGASVPAPPSLERPLAPDPEVASGATTIPAVPRAGGARGIVVDRATGEPVAEVEVELIGGDRRERVVTLADGSFASTGAFQSGRLTAAVADEGVSIATIQTQHDAERGTLGWRLDVPIGPTVPIAQIDGSVPIGPEWQARIRESALAEGIAGEIDVGAEHLTIRAPSAERPDRDWSWIRVRPGTPPWIRYPKHEHASGERLRAAVEVRCFDLRKGRADLRSTVGIQPPCRITTKQFSALSGQLQFPGQRRTLPVRAVIYEAWSKHALSVPSFDEITVGSDGFVSFPEVEPGSKQVFVWSADSRSARSHEFALLPGKTTGPVTIRMHVEPPVNDSQAWLRRNAAQKHLGWSGPTERVVAGPPDVSPPLRRFVASLEQIEDMGDRGPWTRASPLELASSATSIDTPGRGPGIRLASRRVRAFSRSGDEIAGAEIAFGPAGGLFLPESKRTPLTFKVPDALELTWSVWASGCQPEFGSQRDFDVREEDVDVAIARVQPGWGAQLLLRAGDPDAIQKDPWPWLDPVGESNRAELAALAAPPLPGIALEVDGMAAGRSDERGELRIGHPVLPLRLTLACEGWKLCALDRLRGPGQRYVAWMKRAR